MAYAEVAFRERAYFPEAFCPPELDYVWDWFAQDFWPNYKSNGFGVEGLSYIEIGEWARLRNIKLEPIEIRLLKKLDSLFIESINKKAPKTKGVKSEVSADNPKGIKALLAGFSANAKAMKAQQEAKGTLQ